MKPAVSGPLWRKPLFLIVVIAALALDQLSKAYIVTHMVPGEQKLILAPLVYFTLTHNVHGAMGLFGSNGPILIVLALIVLGVFFRAFGGNSASRLVQVSIGMITGGAISNIVDRVRLAYVVDFIDVHVWQEIFNVADSFITIGVSLLILQSLFGSAKKTGDVAEAQTTTPAS